MDAIFIIVLIFGICRITFLELSLSNAKHELSEIKDELQSVIDTIEKSKVTGCFQFLRPKNINVRLILNEYLKLHLNSKLEGRISLLQKIHMGRKPEID